MKRKTVLPEVIESAVLDIVAAYLHGTYSVDRMTFYKTTFEGILCQLKTMCDSCCLPPEKVTEVYTIFEKQIRAYGEPKHVLEFEMWCVNHVSQ